MAIFYRYLRHYWMLVAAALGLAAINQVFALLDPLIFRHIIDSYATRYREYSSAQFLRGVSVLLGAAVGVAFVSRVAKNFQDYFVNVITQQVGARIYADGVRHSLELPYTLFEDQRSGETLGKLQKVRTDVGRFISLAENMWVTPFSGLRLLRTSILLLMLYLIFTQRITVGQFFSLFIYSFFIFGPLQELGNVINVYRETEVSLQNFETILNLPPEPRPERPVTVEVLETLRFDGVFFQHHSASTPALSGISFQVRRGETVAFVGPSGAGKTTLVKLLVGLYRPKTGHIYYNATADGEVAIEDLRERIGFASQDAQLFSGSIRENLRFVRPDASDEEGLQALRQASVESLLERADSGLDTVIGEGGVKVSGGEKQRLSIARALLRRPQLLVFDEATSSLDSLTEEEISQTIRDIGASRDAITILIAHRLSTVLHADRIHVLERAGIVEFGRHAELLANKRLYYAMWRQQVGEGRERIAAPKSSLVSI